MGLEFPEVLLTQYISGSLPRVHARDLNALQREQIRTWRALRGCDPLIDDDFCGDSINRGKWVNQANNPTIEDDSANGAFGVAKLDPSAASPRVMKTRPLVIGTKEFRISTRVKAALTGSVTNPGCLVGLYNDAAASKGIGFWIGADGPNLAPGDRNRWSAYLSNTGSALAYLDLDPGLAIDSSYHTLELIRTTRAVQMLYDGGLVLESTDPTWVGKDFTNAMSLTLYSGGTGSDYYVMRVDSVKLWVALTTLTEATEGSAPATHYEEQTAAIAASTTVSVTWTQAFADTTYKLRVGVFRSDAATAVRYTITGKTTTGITMTFESAITGELYVEAHD